MVEVYRSCNLEPLSNLQTHLAHGCIIGAVSLQHDFVSLVVFLIRSNSSAGNCQPRRKPRVCLKMFSCFATLLGVFVNRIVRFKTKENNLVMPFVNLSWNFSHCSFCICVLLESCSYTIADAFGKVKRRHFFCLSQSFGWWCVFLNWF